LTSVTAGSLGVLAAGPQARARPQPPGGVFPGGNETIKVALVGCGFRGTGAAAQVLQTRGPITLWAMADLFSDRLEASWHNLTQGMKEEYDRDPTTGLAKQIDVPPERRFIGFDAYQKAIDSSVDLVLLTAHQHFRPMHYAYAVKQGKHVFMEKPMGVDVPGVHQLLAANEEAKRKNLKVGVGLYMRHSRRIQETVARVKDGAIGPIVLMSCYFNLGALHNTPPRPPDMTEMTYQLRNPFHFVWLCGDDIVDALVHYLDVFLWLKGEHPARAQGLGGRQFYLPTQQGDLFDHQYVEYTYADGVKMFAQTQSISGCWRRSAPEVYGPRGYADLWGRIEGAKPWRWQGNMPNPYQVEQDVLIDAIRQNKPYNDVDRAAEATLVGIMGRMASYSGQMITWEQMSGCKVSLAPKRYAFDAVPPVVPDATGRYPVAMPGVTQPF
jgi:predicted dehydrogenase